MVNDGVFGTQLPCTGSHEGSGTITRVGSGVKSLKVGDRVMVGIQLSPCAHCPDCLGPENYRQYCQNFSGMVGVTAPGAFAEYVVADERTSVRLPDKVSFETAAPLACAGATVWRGVLQSQLKTGEWLAIIGAGGGLGHLGVQFAKALGLNVVGIDARDEGLELAGSVGADVVIDARKGDEAVVKEVKAVTGGLGAQATLNLSDADSAAATACAVTRMHGKMVQIAQPKDVVIPFQEFVFRDVRVEGSLICSPDEARKMLEVVAEHDISVTTNPVFGLKEVPNLVEMAHSGKMKGKGIVIVDEEQVRREKKLASTQA